ncbi:MAG: glycosyltransferase family 2 protein [Acidobacteriota bacterium]
MGRVLFSVVIPTYNRSSLVRQAVESVLCQSLGDFEILVIDDGSVDDTEEVISRLNDERIHYYKIANGGPGTARNFGMSKAKGDWIAFLDSDDLWLANKLDSVALEIDDHPGCEFLFSRSCTRDSFAGLTPFSEELVNKMSDKVFLLSSFSIYTSSVVVKRSMVERHGVRFGNLATCEDYMFFWKAVAVAEEVRFLKDCFVLSCPADTNLTVEHKFEQQAWDRIAALNGVLDWLGAKDVSKRYASALDGLRYWSLRNLVAYFLMRFDAQGTTRAASCAVTLYGLLRCCKIMASSVRMIMGKGTRDWFLKHVGANRFNQ